MGKKADLIAAAQAISEALRNYVDEDDRAKIHVFESSAGNLRAVAGSKKFRGMSITQRQEEIWAYLRKTVPHEHLRHCFGVRPLDPQEYAEEFFPQSASASLDLHLMGESDE